MSISSATSSPSQNVLLISSAVTTTAMVVMGSLITAQIIHTYAALGYSLLSVGGAGVIGSAVALASNDPEVEDVTEVTKARFIPSQRVSSQPSYPIAKAADRTVAPPPAQTRQTPQPVFSHSASVAPRDLDVKESVLAPPVRLPAQLTPRFEEHVNSFAGKVGSSLLLKQLQKGKCGSVAPHSLMTALSMLLLTCDDRRQEACLRSIFDGDVSHFHTNYSTLIEECGKNPLLNVANGFFFTKEMQKHRGKLQGYYRAADFSDSRDPRFVINADIAANTGGVIQGFLKVQPPGSFVWNVLRFKAKWHQKFDTPEDGIFHSQDGTLLGCKMMSMPKDGFTTLHYLVLPDVGTGVIIPCQSVNPGYSNGVFFVLPNEGMTLGQALAKLDIEALFKGSFVQKAKWKTLQLPKLKAETDISDGDIQKMFREMGLDTTALEECPEFLQKTVIKWDEVGVDAAAATGGTFKSGPHSEPTDITLLFNRPFIYGIMSHRVKDDARLSQPMLSFLGCETGDRIHLEPSTETVAGIQYLQKIRAAARPPSRRR